MFLYPERSMPGIYGFEIQFFRVPTYKLLAKVTPNQKPGGLKLNVLTSALTERGHICYI